MPRHQRTAARKARQQQQLRGGKYTAHLRALEQESAELRLAHALEEAGLSRYSAHLRVVGTSDPEFERVERAYQDAYEAASAADQAGRKGADVEALWANADHTFQVLAGRCSSDPFAEDLVTLRAVHEGFGHAVAHGVDSPCMGPAYDVLTTFQNDWAADAIRCRRPLAGLTVAIPAGDPVAMAAWHACKALAEASRIPFKGDEEWTECSELIGRAKTFACTGAGLQPYLKGVSLYSSSSPQ